VKDIETRLRDAFAEVAQLIPDSPPTSFHEAKARHAGPTDSGITSNLSSTESEFWNRQRPRWSRRPRSLTAIVVAGVIAAGGVGTGIAAAAGAFSPTPTAQNALEQLSKNAARDVAGVQPVGPRTAPGPTTEHFLVTDPGPEGTTITVWSSSPTPGMSCFVAEVSEVGESTFPGKPPNPDGGGCGGAPNAGASASATQLTGGGGSIWRSSSGVLYMIESSATVPSTARVVITFADGTTITPAVGNGWFAFGVPYDEWAAGFTQTEYSDSGTALYTLHQPPDTDH
jgi:hypothetical protein